MQPIFHSPSSKPLHPRIGNRWSEIVTIGFYYALDSLIMETINYMNATHLQSLYVQSYHVYRKAVYPSQQLTLISLYHC